MASSPLANPGATRAVLQEFGLATKHRLGQNFLVNDGVVGQILGLAELTPGDVVLEVGPGIGTLTVALLGQAGAVVAVEADRSLAPVLGVTCSGTGGRLNLVLADALKVPADQLVAGGVDGKPPLPPTKFVSNLPYQVAATVILRFFQELPSVERDVVMVQREVADRIAATPGGRDYGAYTAKLALLARVTGRFEVGPGNFMPPPHVDSAVVRLDRQPLVEVGEALRVSQVIDAAFAQRRKTIRNSMRASGYEPEVLDAAFAQVGIDPKCRAETVAPETFVALSRALEAGVALVAER